MFDARTREYTKPLFINRFLNLTTGRASVLLCFFFLRREFRCSFVARRIAPVYYIGEKLKTFSFRRRDFYTLSRISRSRDQYYEITLIPLVDVEQKLIYSNLLFFFFVLAVTSEVSVLITLKFLLRYGIVMPMDKIVLL